MTPEESKKAYRNAVLGTLLCCAIIVIAFIWTGTLDDGFKAP